MPAKCASPETVILNREIRETIGRRLREHYDLAQRVPLPARLAELAKQFGQSIEPTESNHHKEPASHGKSMSNGNSEKTPNPKDAQKGGQGAIGKDDPETELNERGHPGPSQTGARRRGAQGQEHMSQLGKSIDETKTPKRR